MKKISIVFASLIICSGAAIVGKGSQETLHGRLKNLRLIGYIKFLEQDDACRKGAT